MVLGAHHNGGDSIIEIPVEFHEDSCVKLSLSIFQTGLKTENVISNLTSKRKLFLHNPNIG